MEKIKKIQQNSDTDFLKLIAIISMVTDHVGKIFVPDNIVMAAVGRIAFPLFAYCSVIGCLYTRDFKKYILRLAIFGVISQPFFNLAFHPEWTQFWQEIFSLNIFFTLIGGVLAIKGLMNIKKNWWILLVTLVMEFFIGLDYGLYGITLMIIFYLCRRKSGLSALLVFIWMICNGVGDFVYIGPLGLDRQFFAVLALPLIYMNTCINPRMNKYFFYVFYPAHLLIIYIIRIVLKV